MKIYIAKNGQQLGPFDEEELTQQIQQGVVSYDDLSWVEGMSEWQPLRTIASPPAGSLPPPTPPAVHPTVNERIDEPVSVPRDPKRMIKLAVVLAVLAAAFFGKFHIITGSDVHGFKLAHKDSFGFTDTFINVDVITGMPWIAAKSRFPIGCRVLQRECLIESDEESEARHKREFDKTMEDAQKEAQRLLRQFSR